MEWLIKFLINFISSIDQNPSITNVNVSRLLCLKKDS